MVQETKPEPETGTIGTVFPGTNTRTGTAGTKGFQTVFSKLCFADSWPLLAKWASPIRGRGKKKMPETPISQTLECLVLSRMTEVWLFSKYTTLEHIIWKNILCRNPWDSVAFHPQAQIAGDWVTTSPAAPTRTERASDSEARRNILAYGRRFRSQRASTRCDLRIASPTRAYM